MPLSLIISIYYQQLEQHFSTSSKQRIHRQFSHFLDLIQYSVSEALNYLLYMSKRKSLSLISHFLKDSPASQLRKYKKLFPRFQPDRQYESLTPSDSAYVQKFLKSVQVFGTPVSMLKSNNTMSIGDLTKIFASNRAQYRRTRYSSDEAEQIIQCIKDISNLTKANISDYHEIQQRIVIAAPEVITSVKVKLIYLFKILINRRDKLPQESLELQANINLSQTIFTLLSKHPELGTETKEWAELQALEKLSRAREYKKNGLSQMAINSFAEIFKDEAAAFQTRLEALKILCASGQQLGDASVLEPLVSLAQEKGQKQYEQYLKIVIQRIKKNEQKASDSAK